MPVPNTEPGFMFQPLWCHYVINFCLPAAKPACSPLPTEPWDYSLRCRTLPH